MQLATTALQQGSHSIKNWGFCLTPPRWSPLLPRLLLSTTSTLVTFHWCPWPLMARLQTWPSCFFAGPCRHCFSLHSGNFHHSQGRAFVRLAAMWQFIGHLTSSSEHHHFRNERAGVWDLPKPSPPQWGCLGSCRWSPDHSHATLYPSALLC